MSQQKLSNKERDIFEKSVKPYYHSIDPNQCYIHYSPDKTPLSSKSEIFLATPKEVKDIFGFNLLCNDLPKSVYEAEAYYHKKNIAAPFPEGVPSTYLLEANTINLFVLHEISPKIGFGISTYSALKKGTMIAEYIGERKPLGTYIPDNSYVFISDDGTKIDGKFYGNAVRFFHHCPIEHPNQQVMTANIMSVPWKVSEKLTKVFFMTIRDIKAFEPLCWDYGDKFSFEHDVELLNAETYLPIDELKNEL